MPLREPREIPWILNVRRLPALYTREDVKDRLGLRDADDVSKLVKAKLLPVLRERKGREPMWFWAEDLERRIRDRRWMARMLQVIKGPDEKGNAKPKSLS